MTNVFGAINVPMAVLWVEPGEKRTYDDLILGPATDPAAWTGGMDDDMRLWLVGKVETQALFGEQVLLLNRSDDWLQVAAVGQPTTKNNNGYPGWLPAAQVSFNHSFLSGRTTLSAIRVTAAKTHLYTDVCAKNTLHELSYQTTLPLLAEYEDTVKVLLPDGGDGYILRRDITSPTGCSGTAGAIVSEAKKFLNLRYIWGGTSAFGFDCSGFSFRIFQSQNITIPRDADEQASAGLAVSQENLSPGDLLFFAGEHGQGSIHHVGIYTGNGNMIHAPNSKSVIREEPFTAGIYGQQYWGARRYI